MTTRSYAIIIELETEDFDENPEACVRAAYDDLQTVAFDVSPLRIAAGDPATVEAAFDESWDIGPWVDVQTQEVLKRIL